MNEKNLNVSDYVYGEKLQREEVASSPTGPNDDGIFFKTQLPDD